jgi:hypothetical protein
MVNRLSAVATPGIQGVRIFAFESMYGGRIDVPGDRVEGEVRFTLFFTLTRSGQWSSGSSAKQNPPCIGSAMAPLPGFYVWKLEVTFSQSAGSMVSFW